MRSALANGSMPRKSGLLGRERELRLLRDAWNAGARVITAWGPVGSGKRSLIRFFANELATADDPPVVVHDLSDPREARDLRSQAAMALRSKRSQRPSSTASRNRRRSSPVLLVHGLDSSCPDLEALVREWLDSEPQVRVLTACREALWLPEEERVEVGPLAIADACELLMREARAAAGSRVDRWQRFPELERVVSGLDAIPLALELAAAQLALLTPAELESRLPEQLDWTPLVVSSSSHRSLRVATEQAWNALSPTEQGALQWLSACGGSMAIDVAEQLLLSAVPDRPLRVIERLRRHAMLRLDDPRQSGTRLRLYATVRCFAREALRKGKPWEHAHASFARSTLSQLERAAADCRARADANAVGRLREEEDNGRQAYAWYRGREPDKAGRVVLALQEHFRVHGPFPPAVDLLTEAIADLPADGVVALRTQLIVARAELLRLCGHVAEAASDLSAVIGAQDTDVLTRVEAQRLLGTVQRMRGDLSEALESKRKALQMARGARLRSQEARSLGELGTIHAALGQLQEAARHHRAALDLHRREGDLASEGIELSNLGVATHRLGHMLLARDIHEQAVAIHRKVGNRRSEAGDLCHLAFVLHQTGRLQEADDRFRDALQLCSDLGDRQLAAVVKTWWGDLLTEMNRSGQAAALLHEALGFHEAAEDLRLQAITHLHLSHAFRSDARHTPAADELRSAISLAPPEQAPVIALSHAWLARSLEDSGHSELAATHRREAISGLEAVPSPLAIIAVNLLVGQDQRGKLPMSIEEASSLSSDVRRALVWKIGTQPDERRLVTGAGCQWVALGTQRVELGRRKNLRLIVSALVEARLQQPGHGLPWHVLVEAGWPGEKMSVEAAQKRVYTAIWTLRKAGLDPILSTSQDGYFIDPAVQVTRE